MGSGMRLVIQNALKLVANVGIVVLWVMVQIVVIQEIRVIGLVACWK